MFACQPLRMGGDADVTPYTAGLLQASGAEGQRARRAVSSPASPFTRRKRSDTDAPPKQHVGAGHADKRPRSGVGGRGEEARERPAEHDGGEGNGSGDGGAQEVEHSDEQQQQTNNALETEGKGEAHMMTHERQQAMMENRGANWQEQRS